MEKQVKIASKISKLYEVRQTLEKAKKDLENALMQQDALITIIEESNKKDLIDKNYLEALKSDRDSITARLLSFNDSLTAIDLIIYNYEDEKKNNKKHSALPTEAVFTLTVDVFDIFKDIIQRYQREVMAKREELEKAQNTTETKEETPAA